MTRDTGHEKDAEDPSTAHELSRIAGLLQAALIVALTFVILWLAGRVLLVIFAGALFGVLLNGFARLLACRTGIKRSHALVAVTASLASLIVASIYFLLPGIIAQSSQLADRLTVAFEHMSRYLTQYFSGPQVPLGEILGTLNLPFQLFGFTSSLTTALMVFGIITFVGFYGAVSAPLYVNGFLRLFKDHQRHEMRAILTTVGETLEWWLLGRAVTMSAVGLLVLICLVLLGIPLAVTLSLIATLLTFIPYLGAITAALPAILVAFVQGPLPALYVVLVYCGAYAVEGYVVAPLVQKRAVHMPPALMLSAQAVLGTLFGIIGLALAAPITAVGLVLVRTLYLGDHIAAHGSFRSSLGGKRSDDR